MPVKIGIVFPVHNCLEFTKAAIASIRTQHPYQIYVIDDHSAKPTKDWLSEQSQIVTFTDPPGSTGLSWNWNLGISAALNDDCTHVLVANNDILLHPQTIDSLAQRLDQGDIVLASGDDVMSRCPTPEAIYEIVPEVTTDPERIDFSCFMLTQAAIERVGWFDDNFIGAYYEDNDYRARIVHVGQQASRLGEAPYYHYSMRTVNENPDSKPQIQQRAAYNGEYFYRKWGRRSPTNSVSEIQETYFKTPFNQPEENQAKHSIPIQRLERLFRQANERETDINQHLGYLHRLASNVQHITEFGTGSGQATSAFAYAKPKYLRVYERPRSAANTIVETAARLAGIDYHRIPVETPTSEIEPTDLLFIDTWHVEEQMREDLERHAHQVRRYLVMHDTETFGERGETPGHRGIWPAIASYMRKHHEWSLLEHFPNNNGLTVFCRKEHSSVLNI